MWIPKDTCPNVDRAAILSEYGGARDYDYAMVAEFADDIDHHHVKWAGFMLGAFYYDALAFNLRLPYLPHFMRSHVVVAEIARQNGVADAREIGRKLLSIVETRREVMASSVNDFFGHELFELFVPVVFGALIKRKNDDASCILTIVMR